jgi:hypothetical protein
MTFEIRHNLYAAFWLIWYFEYYVDVSLKSNQLYYPALIIHAGI